MSNLTPTEADSAPEHRASGTPNAWQVFTSNLGARAKKAWSAGVAGAVLAASGVSLSAFFAEGHLDTQAIATAAGAVVVGFVGGFLSAFIPRNA